MSWEERKISDLGNIVTGKTPSTKVLEYFGGEYQFVTPSDIGYGHYYVRNTETTVTEQAKNKHKNQFIPKDSVLFTCIGNTMGKCAIASQECISNQQINTVVPNDEHDPKFLYYLLHHHRNLVRGIGMGGGSATPIINKTTFGKIKLRVPTDKTTQQSISSLLEKYDDLIENNCHRIQLLEQATRLLYKEWFVHLRFLGHEHVKIKDGVPEGWDKVPISSFCVVGRGGSPRPIKDYLDGDVPWFKIGDATASESPFVFSTAEKIIEDGIKKSVILEERELILSNSATCGIPYFTGVIGCIHDGWLYFKELERISKWFLYCFLFEKQREILTGIGEGATQKNLNTDYVGKLLVLLPEEQWLLRKFDEIVEPLFEQIFTLAQENIGLSNARDLLLPRLMNGEIAV